jgi:hypothetical protein
MGVDVSTDGRRNASARRRRWGKPAGLDADRFAQRLRPSSGMLIFWLRYGCILLRDHAPRNRDAAWSVVKLFNKSTI